MVEWEEQKLKFKNNSLNVYLYNFPWVTLLSADCLLLFTAALSNPLTLCKCIISFYLPSAIFLFWDIRLIPGHRQPVDVQYVCLQKWKWQQASRWAPQAAERRSQQGGSDWYSDVNDQGYYDLQEALISSPKLIVFWCLMRSCSLRHLLPPPGLHSAAE